MAAHHLARLVQNVPRRIGFPGVPLHKGEIVPVRNKTDILAVALARVGEALPLRDGAHLRLAQPPQREQGMGKLLPRNGIKHIALIPAWVRPFDQPKASRSVLQNLGVVPGGNQVTAQLPGLLVQQPKL